MCVCVFICLCCLLYFPYILLNMANNSLYDNVDLILNKVKLVIVINNNVGCK